MSTTRRQDEIRANRGTLTEPGKNSPFRDRSVGGKPRPVPPHARRRISQRRARAARQDRHGVGQHQSARSGALPHPACAPIRAPARRGRSIRATISPTASRTPSKASRIRSARWNSRITGRSTTGSSTICACRRGRISTNSRGSISPTRCCRSACSPTLVRDGHVSGWDDPRMPTIAGLAPARRAAGSDPRFRQAHRRRQGQQPGRCRHVRIFGTRSAQQDRAAAHGGAQAAQSRDRELSGRADRGARSGQSSRRSRQPARARSNSAASSISSRTISWRTRRRNSSGCRPAAKCGCATPISSPAAR